jgi:hypothetical protein
MIREKLEVEDPELLVGDYLRQPGTLDGAD